MSQEDYSKISIKQAPKYQINWGNNWKIVQIDSNSSSLCHIFDAFLSIWAIFLIFSQLIWYYLGACFIYILPYVTILIMHSAMRHWAKNNPIPIITWGEFSSWMCIWFICVIKYTCSIFPLEKRCKYNKHHYP